MHRDVVRVALVWAGDLVALRGGTADVRKGLPLETRSSRLYERRESLTFATTTSA